MANSTYQDRGLADAMYPNVWIGGMTRLLWKETDTYAKNKSKMSMRSSNFKKVYILHDIE